MNSGDSSADRADVAPAAAAAAAGQTRWGGRLEHLQPAQLNAEQRELYDYLTAGPSAWAARAGFQAQTDDGRLIGPFNVFLHSPQIGRSYNDLVGVEMTYTSLSPRVREIVILTVGAQWQAPYEVYAHTAVARAVGLSDTAIDAILQDAANSELTAEEHAAHTFTRQLVRNRHVDDATYAQAERVFGSRGLVDMVHLLGFYLTTSALLNAFAVPAPDQDLR